MTVQSAAGGGWEIRLVTADRRTAELFEPALEDIAAAVTLMEQDNGASFRLVAYCDGAPHRGEVEGLIAAIAAVAGLDAPAFDIEPVPDTDWVVAYQNSVGPQTIGRFFVYPSHFRGYVPAGLLPIRLDAGLAFGTGEHGSTRGCLLALDTLEADGMRPATVLDLGCGSAILAIAACLLWPAAHVIAADNDPLAVETANENLARNGCAGRVETAVSDFFSADRLCDAAPFPLIVANILAGPLIAHAAALGANLAPDGRLVLAGLLATQADDVLGAMAEGGLSLAGRYDLGEWTTLTMEKAAG